MMNKNTRVIFANELVRKLSQFKPTMLASITIGGILFATETAKILSIPVLAGRKVAGSVIWTDAGNYEKDSFSRVVLVDDILTTGGTLVAAIQSLEKFSAKVVAVAVAIDRSGGRERNVIVDGIQYDVVPVAQTLLEVWDPADCPICPKPYTPLHNPEEDWFSVILSMPAEKSKMILEGYRDVYKLQKDEGQLKRIEEWEPWMHHLLAGLPKERVREDSGLVNFIRLLQRDEPNIKRKIVLSDFVGNLLAVSNMRVEARSLGCSILVGDGEKLLDILQLKVPIKVPKGINSSNFVELKPYFDALQETDAVFIFDRDGVLKGIMRLVHSAEFGETRGIQLLRQITKLSDSIGLVLRRERKAISVYREGRLEALAELSEKNGLWEFNTSMKSIIEQAANLVPGIDLTLETVLEISREMVNRGFGGIFVIGDVPNTLRRNPAIIEMVNVPLAYIGVGMASEIAKLDGAMFISKDGEVQDATVIIVNGDDEEIAKLDEGYSTSLKIGGSRRETAYRTSKECPHTAVVCVSQNGTIELFINGQSFPITEAISGVSR